MRTSYLVRKNGWMSPEERLLARRIGRDGEKRLSESLMAGDAVSALVFYCAGCAAAVLGRVGARYVEMLAAGEDVSVMQEVFARAQAGAMQSARAMEVLIAGRVGAYGPEGERDWFGEVVGLGKEGDLRSPECRGRETTTQHREGEFDRINTICRMDRIGEEGDLRSEECRGRETTTQQGTTPQHVEATMMGERVASREVAVGLAQGAMTDLALTGEAAQAERVARLAARVPDDTHGAVSARLDEHMATQIAQGNSGAHSQNAGTSGQRKRGETAKKEESSKRVEDFSHLPRRERRYLERQARLTSGKRRRAA